MFVELRKTLEWTGLIRVPTTVEFKSILGSSKDGAKSFSLKGSEEFFLIFCRNFKNSEYTLGLPGAAIVAVTFCFTIIDKEIMIRRKLLKFYLFFLPLRDIGWLLLLFFLLLVSVGERIAALLQLFENILSGDIMGKYALSASWRRVGEPLSSVATDLSQYLSKS